MAEDLGHPSAMITWDLKWPSSSVTDGYGIVNSLSEERTSFLKSCQEYSEDEISLVTYLFQISAVLNDC